MFLRNKEIKEIIEKLRIILIIKYLNKIEVKN